MNAVMQPDTSGNCFVEGANVKNTNDLVDKLVLIFKNAGTAKIKLAFSFEVPMNYVGSPKIVAVCRATATSGKYVLGCEYRAIAAGEAGDPSTFQETATTNPTVPGTALQDQEASITLTAANLATKDRVTGNLYRGKDDGVNDTLAADLIVDPECLMFEYSDV